jgi:recombination protein RecT
MSKELQKTPVNRLKDVMASSSVQQQFKNALAEKSNLFVASLIDLYASDDYLQNCEPQLVVMEALKAATLNLPINKSLGFAYIVPYKKQGKQLPQFQLGYKGMVQLAMRTGQYKYINADVVCEGEYRGFNKLTGELDISGVAESDKVIGYFAHIETVNGFSKTMYMPREQMEQHGKKYSKSYDRDSSPWKSEFDGMAKKTMLRMLLGKYGIMSIDMADGMAAEREPEDDQGYLETANNQLIDIDTETGEIASQPEEPKTSTGPGF